MRTLFLLTFSLAALHASTYHHLVVIGQSLGAGCASDPPVTVSQPFSNLMLTNGTSAPLIPLVPYYACITAGLDEFPLLDTASQLTSINGQIYIASMNAVSGVAYGNMCGPSCAGGPTATFTAGIGKMTTSQTAATGGGNAYVLDGVVVTHGETDDQNGVSASIYESYLVQWRLDYQTQANSALGRTGVLPLFVDQESAWEFYQGLNAVPTTALGQWQAMEDYPGLIYLTTPKYMLPVRGGFHPHLPAASSVWLGELISKAITKAVTQKQPWIPLTPKTNVVSVQFFVPVGALRFDTATVSANTNQGFEFIDVSASAVGIGSTAAGASPTVITKTAHGLSTGTRILISGYTGASAVLNGVTSITSTGANTFTVPGTTTGMTITGAPVYQIALGVTISSVAISGNTVNLTLSAVPTGVQQRVQYAYTATSSSCPATQACSGWGNLKDTDPVTSRSGNDLSDWAVTFDAGFTSSAPWYSKLIGAYPVGSVTTGGVLGSGGGIR
jgi:hypothetical protein